MYYLSMLAKVSTSLFLCGISAVAFAQWELDEGNSKVTFITTKNSAVAESHSFQSLSGHIDADGKIRVEIALDSVETLIPIRNERMRELLFETANFPTATVDSWVDDAVMKAVGEGDVVLADVPVSLSMHGHERPMTVPVVLVGTSGGGMLVVTSRPIVVNAADFDLDAGVGVLQKAAGLMSISTAVPVSFHLMFVPVSLPSIDS